MFLANCAQSVFYSPSKAKHLHHNRRIWALASDVWICTHPNMCITSKFTFDPLLDKMLWKFAAPDLRIWFWGLWWASARHLHRYRNSHSHLPEADLQNSTGVTTLFPLFQSDNICFDFLELGLRQTTWCRNPYWDVVVLFGVIFFWGNIKMGLKWFKKISHGHSGKNWERQYVKKQNKQSCQCQQLQCLLSVCLLAINYIFNCSCMLNLLCFLHIQLYNNLSIKNLTNIFTFDMSKKGRQEWVVKCFTCDNS